MAGATTTLADSRGFGVHRQALRGLVHSQLSNGVRVLILPTRAPHGGRGGLGYRGVVAAQLWVGAGAAAERESERGCAHLLEHMLFKPTGPGSDLAGLIEGLGGEVNAFTSHDETVFHLTAPAPHAGEAVEGLLAATLPPRRFDRDELGRELGVVREELRHFEDDPVSAAVQRLVQRMHRRHPYARPILGVERDLRKVDGRRLSQFHRRHYRGQNLTLVVVGPVDTDRVMKLARARLRAVPALARATALKSVPLRSRASVHVTTADVHEAHIRIGFVGPAVFSPDPSALEAAQDGLSLDLAAVCLGQGEASRLSVRTRRRDQLVSDAYVNYMPSAACGNLMLSAQTRAESAQAAALALFDELEELTDGGPDQEELARARAAVRSSVVYRGETVQGRAQALGYYSTSTGDPNAESSQLALLDDLAADRIARACQRYLSANRACVEIVLPRQAEATTESMASTLAERLRRRRDRGARISVPRRAKGNFRVQLPCGLVVCGRPDHQAPIVSGWLVWSGGQRLEAPAEAGLAYLSAALLTRGSKGRTGDVLAKEIDGTASALEGFCGPNSTGLQIEALSENFDFALKRGLDCARFPSFDELELEEERRVALQDLTAEVDEPGRLAYRRMLSLLFGDHPHGRDLRGSENDLQNHDREAVVRHWEAHHPIGRAVLAVAGDFDVGSLVDGLAERLDGAPVYEGGRQPTWPGPPPQWPTDAVEVVIERPDRDQGHLVVGLPGLCLGDPREATLDVMMAMLSGHSGRLFNRLREDLGLVYQVAAAASEGIDAGHLFFYLAAAGHNLEQAREALWSEVRDLAGLRGRAARDEVERAKRTQIGQFEIGLQRRARVASRLAFGEVYDLGLEHYLRFPARVAKVKVRDVAALADELLTSSTAVTVTVKPK